MGSNMQRQAVPLVRPETPMVDDGHRGAGGAVDSGQVILAERRRRGHRRRRAADHACSYDGGERATTYPLLKFVRSNQGTCINQRPMVQRGDRVRKGDSRWPTAPRPDKGELALGPERALSPS